MKEQRNALEEPTEKAQPQNPTWQALEECQITLPFSRLLQLMPRFTHRLKSTSCTGSDILFKFGMVDTSNTTITAIIKGRELLGTIVNGELGVNMISLWTCNTLGIQEWEPCPFGLQVAEPSSVQLASLIRNLKVTIGGHAFQIFDVFLQLNAKRAYPLLLGQPWLRTTHIKQN